MTFASGANDSSRTIRLKEVTTEFAVIDLGDAGPSVGDMFTFHGELFDRHCDEVGTDAGTCTQTTAAGESHCVVTVHLAGGDIASQGLIGNAEIPFSAAFAVTGGTGKYRDVDGQIRVEQVSEEEAHFTVRLV